MRLSWKLAYEQMAVIADEALGLVDAYSGGDSENLRQLDKNYKKLSRKISKTPPR